MAAFVGGRLAAALAPHDRQALGLRGPLLLDFTLVVVCTPASFCFFFRKTGCLSVILGVVGVLLMGFVCMRWKHEDGGGLLRLRCNGWPAVRDHDGRVRLLVSVDTEW